MNCLFSLLTEVLASPAGGELSEVPEAHSVDKRRRKFLSTGCTFNITDLKDSKRHTLLYYTKSLFLQKALGLVLSLGMTKRLLEYKLGNLKIRTWKFLMSFFRLLLS